MKLPGPKMSWTVEGMDGEGVADISSSHVTGLESMVGASVEVAFFLAKNVKKQHSNCT